MPVQLTIREMKQQATSPRFWVGLLVVVCILTVSAPFDTETHFNWVQRFFYWGGVAISTYFCAIFVLLVMLRKLKRSGKNELLSRVVASVISALLVVVLVFFINTVIVGIEDFHWKAFLLLGINCMLISLAISTLSFIFNDSLARAKATGENHPPSDPIVAVISNDSPFYERLPKSLGTDVISLQAQDHYVDVRTALGNELILIRLSDATKELAEKNGIQVHRSWWVTRKHMVELKRIDGKPHLLLSDNSLVPVSRTYLSATKAALAESLGDTNART